MVSPEAHEHFADWRDRRRSLLVFSATVLIALLAFAIVEARPARAASGTVGRDLFEMTLEELLEVKVVTPAAGETSAGIAPATVIVVTEDVIRRRGYADLLSLLEDLPGIQVDRNSSTEWGQNVTIQGITGNEKFLVLLDGFRINSTSSTPHSMGHNFSLANAKQVEVVLGPASALYGADAFSGVVNVITHRGDEIHGAHLVGSYGSYSTNEDSLVLGGSLGDASLAVTGGFYSSDEPNLADAYPKDYAWYFDPYQHGHVLSSLTAPPDGVVDVPVEPYATPSLAYFVNTRLDVGDFRLQYTRHSDSHSSSVPARPEFALYQDDAQYTYTIQSLGADYAHKLLNDDLQLETLVAVDTYEVDPSSRFLNVFSAYQPAFKYEEWLSGSVEQRVSYRVSERFSGTVGASYGVLDGTPKTADLPKRFDPDLAADAQDLIYIGTDVVDSQGRDLSIPQDVFHVRYENAGGFLELRAEPIDRVTATVGARYDNNSRYGSSFTPRAGLAWEPLERTRVKLLYGEAFLSPSPFLTYQHFGAFLPATDAQGRITGLESSFFRLTNPNLDPERLRSVELGVSHTLDEVTLSARGFFTDVRDLIQEETSTGETFKGWPVALVSRSVNRGDARFYGGTFGIDALWKPAGFTVSPHLAYTFSKGEVDEAEAPVQAAHTIKGGVDVAWRSLSLSTRMIYRSDARHPVLESPEGGAERVPDSTVVNAFVRYSDLVDTEWGRLSLWLRFTNLLDRRYYHVSTLPDEFPASPQDPIRVVGGIDIDL